MQNNCRHQVTPHNRVDTAASRPPVTRRCPSKIPWTSSSGLLIPLLPVLLLHGAPATTVVDLLAAYQRTASSSTSFVAAALAAIQSNGSGSE